MATIIIKNSTGSGVIPSSLVQGELAINTKDGRLFYGSGSGNVVKEFTATAFPYTGSATITGSLTITGSTTSTLGFTGSLQGTASYVSGSIFTNANPALSASYALTASYALNAGSGGGGGGINLGLTYAVSIGYFMP
jgi:hypothetical protein